MSPLAETAQRVIHNKVPARVVHSIRQGLTGAKGDQGDPGEGIDPGYVAAMDAANSPGTGNPFAVMSDLALVGVNTASESTISFVDGTRTFSITPVGATFGVWLSGPMLDKETASVVIANSVGQHFVYFDGADGLLKSSTSPWDLTANVAPVATVYWDGAAGWIGDERHAPRNLAARLHHRWMHSTIGARYADGLAGTFGDASLSIAAGAIFDEDIELRNGGAVTVCRVLYRNASNQMVDVPASAVPYLVSAGALQYDDGDGTPANVSASQYVTNWVYQTNDPDYPVYVVASQGQFATVALARAAGQPSLPNINTREWRLLYAVIYRNVAGTPTFIESTDYRTVSSLPGGAVVSLPAAAVTFTPAGNLAAVNVQAALEEVDGEKLAAGHATDAGAHSTEFAAKLDTLAITSEVTAIPTLDDTYKGYCFIHTGNAQTVNLPTGSGMADGWWIEAEHYNGQLTFATQNSDLLLHKDGHTKTAGDKAAVHIQRDATGLQKITLTSATNFATGGKITGATNGGKGDIVRKITNDLYVRVTAGSFASGENVDNADPYNASETTVNGAPVSNVTIYSLVGQTA